MLKILLLASACVLVPAMAEAVTYSQPNSPCKSSIKSWATTSPGSVNWKFDVLQGGGHMVWGTIKYNAGGTGGVHIGPIKGSGYCVISISKN
jgi:hypothetical protein